MSLVYLLCNYDREADMCFPGKAQWNIPPGGHVNNLDELHVAQQDMS